MKAKAAVFMGANVPFEVREFEITDTPAGYGRSELIASGICGTDVHFHNGKLSVAARRSSGTNSWAGSSI